ncbi:MAG: GerMN domain-containing protein [Lachnospiraceae bacterium]|nr:GerMN domain-containing protein [Lachnospiraceae bacterium]
MLRNRIAAAFAICVTGMLCLLSGCSSGDTYSVVAGNVIYCLDGEEESLESEAFSDAGGNPDKSIADCLALIEAGPSKRGHKKLLVDNVAIQNYNVENGNVTIDFSKEYLEMERPREVLARAGIVRSLMQIQGVVGVSFTVNGAPIRDSKGQEIGAMTSDTFIENAGRQLNTYSHSSINLYYASEDGKHLKKESRSIYYSSSKLLEWAVVERLILGPKAKGSRLAIPSNVQILSVSTSEGICYVNLDSAFQANILTVSSEVTLYSIVNSLVEDCNVSAVQFSINGESDVEFDEGLSLKKPFEADMSLVID